ncbi:MAG TPA: PIN domain-containing protein [Acidimicrobiales bacterium]|nr:PIN domain-containing protein [Acidimicrobiales bacterium]
MSTVFADTGAWIALLSRDDRRHAPTVHRYRQLLEQGDRLLTNNYVVDETATHLRYRLGLPAAVDFRAMVQAAAEAGRVRVAWVDERTEDQGWQVLQQYAAVGLSLTDAVSAAMARAGRITEIFGCDHDFEALGFTVLPGYH